MGLLIDSLPGVRPIRAAVEATAVGPCSGALLPEAAESTGMSRLRGKTVGETAESSPGQQCADLMIAFVPPTPSDGPSHTPFGAHWSLLAATGAGPFGRFVVRLRQSGFSSESAWRRHQARTSRTARARRIPGTRGRPTSVDQKRAPGPKRRLDSNLGVCQENRYARAGLYGPSLEVVTKLDPVAHGDLDKFGPGLFGNRRDRGAGQQSMIGQPIVDCWPPSCGRWPDG